MIEAMILTLAMCASDPPTWDSDVRAIMSNHCTSCHAPGRAGPFPLVTHDDVARRAGFIATVTARELMPPWLPSDEGVALQGHRGLSDDELETLKVWAGAGAPVGDDASPATVPDTSMPPGDVVITMPEPWTMPAEGGHNWGRRDRDKWTFVMPIGNDTPLRVRGITHRTSVPEAVHAVTFLADSSGGARYADDITEGPGHYMHGDAGSRPTGVLGASGVGHRMTVLPEGYHWDIDPDAELVMETHYRPSGRTHDLQDSVSLLVSSEAPSRPVRTIIAMTQRIDLPAGASERFVDELIVPVDVHLVALLPRAQGICTAIRVVAQPPGEEPVVLLDMPEYDPHWRMAFQPVDPVPLPTGTLIRTTFDVSNTRENVRNPFLPLDRLAMSRRTGALSVLLHVAAENDQDDDTLTHWHRDLMRSRLR